MSKPRALRRARLTCTDVRFVQVEFPRQIQPRLVIEFSEGLSLLLEAGTNNALIYTLLANCRAQGIDPEDYLIEVLKRLSHEATQEEAAALTPARIAAERRAKAEVEEVA